MIELEDVSKKFGDVTAVDGVNLQVKAGEVFGFVGPNGAGKTTTIRMVVGLIRPSNGKVQVAGHNMLTDPVQAKLRVGYIPDRPYLYEKLTAKEFLLFVAGLYGVPTQSREAKSSKLLQTFGLEEYQDRLIESFSHGMKQRLVLAAALVHDPPVLVVDEPMVGLDPRGARLIKDLFRDLTANAGKTVFLSTHSLDVAEAVCDRIAVIHGGRIAATGTMEQFRERLGNQDAHLEEVFFKITGEESP